MKKRISGEKAGKVRRSGVILLDDLAPRDENVKGGAGKRPFGLWPEEQRGAPRPGGRKGTPGTGPSKP